MSRQIFKNNAKGALNANITNVATALVLKAGQGALFPSPAAGEFFAATLINNAGQIEVIYCTARTGDSFDTITRGEEGTTARAYSTNDNVQGRVTKGSLENFVQKDDSFAAFVTYTNADTGVTLANITRARERFYKINTGAGVVQVNLPAIPVDGEIVTFKRTTTDGTTFTTGRNGKNMELAAANYVDNNPALSYMRWKYDATSGWLLIGG